MKNQNDNHCTVKIPVLHFIYLSVYYLFHFWIGIKVKHRNDNHCSVKIPVLHLIYLSMYYLFFVPCFCQQRIQIGGADYLIGRFLSRDRFLYICWAYWFTNSEWIFGNVLNERTSMNFGPCFIRTGTLNRQPRVLCNIHIIFCHAFILKVFKLTWISLKACTILLFRSYFLCVILCRLHHT